MKGFNKKGKLLSFPLFDGVLWYTRLLEQLCGRSTIKQCNNIKILHIITLKDNVEEL